MKDKIPVYEFIKCTEGHVYESNLVKCPYCGGKNLEDDLVKLINKNPGLMKKLLEDDMAMCYLKMG